MTTSAHFICGVCHSGDLRCSLSFDEQSPSNRFVESAITSPTAIECYRLSLGYCEKCGTIQLVERMPITAVRPRHDWLVYNEPEGHLDEVAGKLADLVGDITARFIGVTYKDQSTLDRMARLGFANTACISEADLKCPVKPFGLETIQDVLSNGSTVSRLQQTYGRADVLLVRHIVEHATDASKFVQSLRGLLAPGGYMVFELPDSERILSVGNHAFIWEEHISYFTATSVIQLAQAVGAQLVDLARYVYPFEDSLVVVFRFDNQSPVAIEHKPAEPLAAAAMLESFAASLGTSRNNWREQINALRNKGEKVAVFGGGHLAAKFINFYGLADLIDCVIDDHPRKQGMSMPGSGLPICSSAELASRGIRVCISTLSPESEAKVRSKLSKFFVNGGVFISAFSSGSN